MSATAKKCTFLLYFWLQSYKNNSKLQRNARKNMLKLHKNAHFPPSKLHKSACSWNENVPFALPWCCAAACKHKERQLAPPLFCLSGFPDRKESYSPNAACGLMFILIHIVRARDKEGSAFPCMISLIRGALIPSKSATFFWLSPISYIRNLSTSTNEGDVMG